MKDMVVKYFRRGFISAFAYYKYLVIQQKEYKMNSFLKFFGFPARLFVVVFLWSVLTNGTTVSWYYFVLYYIGVFAINLMYPYVRVANRVVSADILGGQLSKYLTRGIPYWSTRLGDWFATIQWYLITVIPIYIIAVIIFIQNVHVWDVIGFIFLFFSGSLIALTMWIMVGMSAFFLEHVQGPLRFFMILFEFCNGSLLPLFLFPKLLVSILNYLPFKYIVYVPLQVLLGKYQGIDVLYQILISFGWLMIIFVLAYALWSHSIKKYISSFV